VEEIKIPDKRNFCASSFRDWLEVDLIGKCNGNCSWCIERPNWRPKKVVGWRKISNKAIGSGSKNIMLLGGEPTLHKDFRKIVKKLHKANLNVYVTTNGSLLTKKWVHKNMRYAYACNLSIHHDDLEKNENIVGIKLLESNLIESISAMHEYDITVRMNCNAIHNEIDTKDKMLKYIRWCKKIGADEVRLSELKLEEENFVDLAKVWNYEYGLNDEPFTLGCVLDATIEGMPVNFRQLCGYQTTKRKYPGLANEGYEKRVLYYDGFIYDGWQI